MVVKFHRCIGNLPVTNSVDAFYRIYVAFRRFTMIIVVKSVVMSLAAGLYK